MQAETLAHAHDQAILLGSEHLDIDLAAEPLPEILLCGFMSKGDKVGEIE